MTFDLSSCSLNLQTHPLYRHLVVALRTMIRGDGGAALVAGSEKF